MLESSAPVLIVRSKENSLSVTCALRSPGIAVRASGLPNCLGWLKTAATAHHVFPLLHINDPLSAVGAAFAVPHLVTVK